MHWFDLLDNIIYKEPVAVRGAFGFGLVDIARALNQPGMAAIFDDIPALPSRALSAMAGAWSAAEEASRLGVPLDQRDAMRRMVRYSEARCRTMMELLKLLRRRGAVTNRQAA